MNPTETRSIRGSLLRSLLTPLLLLLVIGGGCSYWLAVYFANTIYDAWLYDSANSLALLVDRDGDRATCEIPIAAEEIFLWDETDSTYFSVRGERSGVLVSNAILPALEPGADRYRDAWVADVVTDRSTMRVIALHLDRERAGENVWVQVAETGTKRKRLARTILLTVLIPQVILICAAVVAVNLGVRKGLLPLLRLSRRLKTQDPRSIQSVPDADVPEEVLPLTQAVNRLLQGLNDVLVSQRRFIADAAHQLRTPLTGIKLNSERAIEESGGPPTPTLEQLRVSASRAARLANQLLTLARAETGIRDRLDLAAVDVCALARERGAQWVPQALAKGIDLGFHADQDRVWIRGDALLLGEALDNVLDNAIKYHPGPGHIELRVQVDEEACLRVEDDGPGVPPDLHQTVFERFNRGTRCGTDGNGLGLSIVAEIAAALGGRVWMQTAAASGGTVVTLAFPPSGPG